MHLKKRNLLERLIVDLHMNQVIVFCKTKQSVDQVTRDLVRRNIAAQSIHGDKSQQSRLETLNAFKEGTLRVLVATDVAARGLDIAELPFGHPTTSCQPNLKTTSTESDVPAGPVPTALPFP